MKKLLLMAVASVLLVGCTLGKKAETTTEPVVDQTQESTVMDGEAVNITVNAANYSFDPKEIRVKKGQRVTINFVNTDGMHDFVIDELAVNSGVTETGQSVELTIPTDQVGMFAYYCSVEQHRANGMEGLLIIEE